MVARLTPWRGQFVLVTSADRLMSIWFRAGCAARLARADAQDDLYDEDTERAPQEAQLLLAQLAGTEDLEAMPSKLSQNSHPYLCKIDTVPGWKHSAGPEGTL